MFYKSDFGSWTLAYQKFGFGVALLFYKPEKRLSISIWSKRWSKNFKIYGPQKLSWEKKDA